MFCHEQWHVCDEMCWWNEWVLILSDNFVDVNGLDYFEFKLLEENFAQMRAYINVTWGFRAIVNDNESRKPEWKSLTSNLTISCGPK